MTAVDTSLPQGASQSGDLRRKAGLAVAAAWLLTHLWLASPLPYLLAGVVGQGVVVNTTQERGLLVGFALALAFLLFEPRRLKLPPAADLGLAALAAYAGSFITWHYDHLALNPLDPGGFALGVAFVGLVLLLLASLRVFGWFGAALIALLACIHLAPLAFGLPLPVRHGKPDALLSLHWFSTESVFGLPLGLWGVTGFFFVVLGCAYDVLGYGRRVARTALRPLPPEAPVEVLAQDNRVARRLWALAFFFFVSDASLLYGPDELLAFANVAPPLLLGFLLYLTFLAVTWRSRRAATETGRARRLSLGAGGMLFGFAAILSLLPIVVTAVAYGLVGGSGLPRFVNPSAWLLLLLVLAILLTVPALRAADSSGRDRWLAATALLPTALFLWQLTVVRMSPSTSAFYAAVLMLAVMALRCIVRSRGGEGGSAARRFRQEAFLPLCHATARVMVRVVILAALYGMVITFAYYGVTLLEVLLD